MFLHCVGHWQRQDPSWGITQERWQSSQVPRQIREAAEDPFLEDITATSGPAAYYKENRLSGLYKKVDISLTKLRLTAALKKSWRISSESLKLQALKKVLESRPI